MQDPDAKLSCMQVPEQNGHGGGEESHSIALSLPYTQRAQRELRVSKQQVWPSRSASVICMCCQSAS